MKNYYEILGVRKTASLEEIKKRYHDLVRKYHPDINQSEEANEILKEINHAYDVLSDSLKRADYDQYLEKISEKEKSKGFTEYQKTHILTIGMFLSAFGRTFFVGLIGIFIGAIIEFILWTFIKQPAFKINILYPGIIAGGLTGLILGGDLNFNVESFLGSSYLSRTYTFLRTFIYALSFSYFGGRIFYCLKILLKGTDWFSILGIIFGLILGATFGSDNEGFFKLKTKDGRFNLFYTALRAIEIGFLGLLIAVAYGLVVQFLLSFKIIYWFGFLGFSLGVIIGAISPTNLAAYSSYASSAIKNIIIILMVSGALILGIVFSYVFHDFIKRILEFIF